MIYEGLFTRQLVDAYLFFFFTTRIFCSPVIHRGLSGGELVLKRFRKFVFVDHIVAIIDYYLLLFIIRYYTAYYYSVPFCEAEKH